MRFTSDDYYAILSVSHDAGKEEIKRAYRKLALEYHPDRNPGNPEAEERFKKISEAYAVLIDPEKRAEYDRLRNLSSRMRGDDRTYGERFSYSQEDLFQNLFSNPETIDLFRELQEELARMGVRFDEHFFNHIFFGGRSILLGGFIFGPMYIRYGNKGTPRNNFEKIRIDDFLNKDQKPSILGKGLRLLGSVGKKIGSLFLEKSGFNLPAPNPTSPDLTLDIFIPPEVATTGGDITVRLPHFENAKTVSVKIPSGIRDGIKIRLKGMGHSLTSNGERGDLYLRVKITQNN